MEPHPFSGQFLPFNLGSLGAPKGEPRLKCGSIPKLEDRRVGYGEREARLSEGFEKRGGRVADRGRNEQGVEPPSAGRYLLGCAVMLCGVVRPEGRT